MAARQAARDQAGKYSEMAGADPGDLDLSGHRIAERRAALAANGFVPAVARSSVVDPASTSFADEWWAEHFIYGEYNHGEGSVPKLPDDNTPSMTFGSALSGHRRTHRMKYEGAGVVVRMPSATAIRRFGTGAGHKAFDVPVSVTRPDGSTASGWVRVTGQDYTWDAHAMGFNEFASDEPAISEAVASILEARRPTVALRQAGNLLAKHQERLSQRGVTPAKVDSAWIEGVGYDSNSSMMVMTTNGRSYGYRVTRDTFEAVRGAHSVGAVFNRLVRRKADTVPVTGCINCGRVYTGGRHSCLPDNVKRFALDPFAARIKAAFAKART